MLFQPVYLPLSDSGFGTEFLKQVKELELQGVSAAEAGDLKGALQLFSQAIQILPQRASAYNNRAQALRLQGDTAGTCHKFNKKSFQTAQCANILDCQVKVQRDTSHQTFLCQVLSAMLQCRLEIIKVLGNFFCRLSQWWQVCAINIELRF